MSEITRTLERVQQGDPKAADKLLPLVYDELRRPAAHKMAKEAPGHTLQPTALVHEAWLRLVGNEAQPWNGRGHFIAAAAEAMRRILIDLARRKRQVRHGGGQKRVALDELNIALPDDRARLLQVHEALDELAATDSTKALVVKLRFFVGLSNGEIADLLGLSERTVERAWTFAKAWLFATIRGQPPPEKKS
jgi:RNA polymerase sigma factor (TIGR02999 family)